MQASIYRIKPFDAKNGTTIKFSWSGNRAFGNRCIIVREDDSKMINPIYDNQIASMKLEHTIDLSKIKADNPLVNGEKYIAFITVFDEKGNESDIQSLGQLFLCLQTPTFEFINISNNEVIDSSSYDFQVKYLQEDSEPLNSWKISVYDNNGKLLSSSNVKYDVNEVYSKEDDVFLYYSISHQFSGFVSGNEYKIQANGETINGMMIETRMVEFSASYDMAAVFSMLELTNVPKTGAILIHSNIISADGKPKYEPVEYINDTYVDLRNNIVVYDEGFILDGDFSMVYYAYNIAPNVPFYEFYSNENPNFKGSITYRVGYIGSNELVGQLELKLTHSPTYSNTLYSPTIPAINSNTLVGFCLIRKNGVYEIRVVDLEEVV